MEEIKRDIQYSLVILALVVAFFLNRDCTPDPYCDPDPMYGGCSSTCEYGSWTSYFGRACGVWFLANVVYVVAGQNLKDRKNLKQFIIKNNLGYDVKQISEELERERKESNERVNQIIANIKREQNKKD